MNSIGKYYAQDEYVKKMPAKYTCKKYICQSAVFYIFIASDIGLRTHIETVYGN